MLQELRATSSLLESVIGQYHSTCIAVRTQHASDHAFTALPDSESILSELKQLASYETKIKESQKALGKLRNRRHDIVPFHSLPPELIARVFRLACRTGRCCLHNPSDLLKYPSNFPIPLMHVCSYWRSLVAELPELWTHIDLAPYSTISSSLLTRAGLFAARAGQIPIDIHIDCSVQANDHEQDQLENQLEFCTSVAPRAESIILEYSNSSGSNVLPFLGRLLSHCGYRRLSRLVIKGPDSSHRNLHKFIMSHDFKKARDDAWKAETPHETFEDVLDCLTVLHVDGIYPFWHSRAYSMLMKLHLTDMTGGFLTVSALARVLNESPMLSHLYLGAGSVIADSRPAPIRLDWLEVLHLEFNSLCYDCVLRLILPGPKPLRMTTVLPSKSGIPTGTEGEYGEFLARSNISLLHAHFTETKVSLSLQELFELAPGIRVLSLKGFSFKYLSQRTSVSLKSVD